MKNEFPHLEEKEHQKEFLGDWWSKKKLFRAGRYSGKTTMMLCEARRFSDKQFLVVFLCRSLKMSSSIEDAYQNMFGEKPTFDIRSYYQLKNGSLRGRKADVVICDEFQEIEMKTFNQEVMPMNPMFTRASACKSSMKSTHYLAEQEDGDFFDSVYDY